MRLLIVGDTIKLQEDILVHLKAQGHSCDQAPDVTRNFEKILSYDYDCIVLNISLRASTGLNMLTYLQKNDKADAVLIVASKSAVLSLKSMIGCSFNHFLPKPFFLPDLSKHIESIVRKRRFENSRIVVLNDIMINIIRKDIMVNDVTLKFTPREYDLILYLIANKNKTISRVAIARYLMGDNWRQSNFDFVYTHLKSIKKKLAAANSVCQITTVYGSGYKLV